MIRSGIIFHVHKVYMHFVYSSTAQVHTYIKNMHGDMGYIFITGYVATS